MCRCQPTNNPNLDDGVAQKACALRCKVVSHTIHASVDLGWAVSPKNQ